MKYLTLIFLFGALTLSAQNTADALRYSTFQFGSTARAVGAGNAFGALGGDFSVVNQNPAGLAVYRKGEFVFTPAFYDIGTQTEVAGTVSDETTTRFSFDNVGLVFAGRPIATKWATSNWGIGFNRTANYHRRFNYGGSTRGSITDEFLEIADGFLPEELDDFQAGPAFDAGAIFNPDPDDPTFYTSDFPLDSEADPLLIRKNQLVASEGGTSELSVSYAANYDEKFMIGFTVGVPVVNYVEAKRYEEVDANGEVDFFDELFFDEDLTVTGIGINGKIGVIGLITREFRVGAAVHTPSWLSLEESFTTAITYQFTDDTGVNRNQGNGADGRNEFNLRTPWRTMLSGAYLFGSNGFLSAEVEFVDQSSARFNYDDAFQADEDFANEQIDQTFKSQVNFRLGGEVALQKFRARAGVQLNGSPYENTEDGGVGTGYSGGLGYRGNSFFADLAYQRIEFADTYRPYRSDFLPATLADNTTTTQRIMLTLGFKF